jgi:hypothetical protein
VLEVLLKVLSADKEMVRLLNPSRERMLSYRLDEMIVSKAEQEIKLGYAIAQKILRFDERI